MLLQHHPNPLLRLLSSSFPTQLADQRRTPATEASAQVSRPGNPGPADKNALILYGPTFAKSGWVRAARGNSCLGSHQKKERDFFDYRPFVHPPLRLAYSLGLHSRGAASQCNGTLCALEISLNSCLCFKRSNSLVLLLFFLFFNVATSTFAGTEQHGTGPLTPLLPSLLAVITAERPCILGYRKSRPHSAGLRCPLPGF